jgi:hypothetical protein
VTTCKDGRENLLNDRILSNDHFLQLRLHQLAMLAKFLQDFSQIAGLRGQKRNPHLE